MVKNDFNEKLVQKEFDYILERRWKLKCLKLLTQWME